MYSTLALEKEREIVKEETALRKEKEAVYAVMYMYMYMYMYMQLYKDAHNRIYTQTPTATA